MNAIRMVPTVQYATTCLASAPAFLMWLGQGVISVLQATLALERVQVVSRVTVTQMVLSAHSVGLMVSVCASLG